MTATLTIELKPEVGRALRTIGAHPPAAAALAAEAVASYVERESCILDAIARGLADMKAGRLVPHDEAMDELDAAIELAAEKQVTRPVSCWRCAGRSEDRYVPYRARKPRSGEKGCGGDPGGLAKGLAFIAPAVKAEWTAHSRNPLPVFRTSSPTPLRQLPE